MNTEISNDSKAAADSNGNSYTPNRILITGGAGFVASNFILFLMKKYPHYQITCLDRLDPCSNTKNLSEVEFNPNFTFVRGDICSKDLVMHILKSQNIDVIFHAAAQSCVDQSFTDPMEFTRSNVLGTQVLLECSKSLEGQIKRFIHVSTDECYRGVPLDSDDRCREDCLLEPTNIYSSSKAAAEQFVTAYNFSFKIPTIITRSNNVIGRHQYLEKIIPKFSELLSRGLPCPVHGNGLNRRSFIHVDDVCNAFDLILHKGSIGEIYNIGTDSEISNLDTLKLLIQIFREYYPECLDARKSDDNYINFVRDRPYNDLRYRIDSSKLKKLGWNMKYASLHDMIKSTVDWYIKNKNYWENAEQALQAHPSEK